MALYREEDPNKLPSINSLSIDDVISGNIKPSTAVSNITPSVNTVPTTTQNVSQPSSQQSTVNKNVNLPSINEVSLDDIVQTPPKVPQVQQTQQIQQQGITWKETLKYLPGQFTIDNLKKTIPQAIVSTFKGGAKEIAKFLVDVADVALDITPKNFKEKNKLVLDKWRDNLKLEPTEVPGAIAAQIGEVIVGIGVTKEVLTKVPTISKFAKAFPKTFNVVNSGITGATIGQIGMDNEATFKDRVKQAAIDFPTWVAFSATGGIPAKKYYAYLPSYFATGYLSSKLEGADHQDALVSGLMTAAIGGGLHAISKPQQETINKMRQAQLEEANRTLAQYGVYDKTSYLNAMHKYHPDVSKLPEEKAQKITTAINTAWTIKNNPPQAVERSLMQEINDLINVIKSPDKAKAMENIGKTTPPIALIPEQITPEGEVKPTIEPTVGPVKAPTEIKPTQVEKAPTAPTVIEAPPAELTATEITPTTAQPKTPEVSVVKPPTIETTPTETTPSPEIPTGATAQPTIAKAPVVKVPEQPAITPEAETEVKIPEIKPKEVAKPVVGTKIVPKELEPLAKEARKYKSAEEFKKALGKTQGVLWSGRKGGITDLSKPLFTSENPNLALTYSLNYPENLELAEKDLQAFIPKDGKTLDLTTNKKAIQYLKKIGIDVKEGYSVRQTVYNNWNKIINEAKKDGYDYINHIGEDEFAQFLDIETVVLNPQKSLQSLTDFYNQAVKGTKKTKITEEVKPVPKELEPLAKEAKKYKTPEEFIDTLKKQGKIFYHGTPYKFDKFDISRVGERGRTEGRGFYFTDRPEVAKTYTNKPGEKIIPKEGVVIEAYLDIKKPMSVSQRKITDNQLTKIVSELSKTNDSLIPSYGDSVKDVVDALKTNDTDVDIISELGNVGVNAQEINDVVQKITGYDGIIEKTPYGKVIVAFNPSQIKTKSQLTDIWNKVHKETKTTEEVKLERKIEEVKPKIEVEEKIPEKKVGKETKVAKSIEAKAKERGITKGFEGLAEYTPITIKEQTKIIGELMEKNIDKATRMVSGEIPLDKGIKGAMLVKMMEDYAMENKDANLILKIAQSPLLSETSEAGQTLRLLAEREPDSATARIRELKRVREEVAEKKRNGKTRKKIESELRKDLDKRIAKTKPHKASWEALLNEIVC